jgi:hypothetical protein
MLTGDPVPIVGGAVAVGDEAGTNVSAASNVILVYGSRRVTEHDLVWFNRRGDQTLINAPAGPYLGIALSPNDMHVAFHRRGDIWRLDLATAIVSGFTTDGNASFPVWSFDAPTIAFASHHDGQGDIHQRASGMSGPQEILLDSPSRACLYHRIGLPMVRTLLITNGDRRRHSWTYGQRILPQIVESSRYSKAKQTNSKAPSHRIRSGSRTFRTNQVRRRSGSRHFRRLRSGSSYRRPAALSRAGRGMETRSFTSPPMEI